jgi:hypothetical protein
MQTNTSKEDGSQLLTTFAHFANVVFMLQKISMIPSAPSSSTGSSSFQKMLVGLTFPTTTGIIPDEDKDPAKSTDASTNKGLAPSRQAMWSISKTNRAEASPWDQSR